MYKVMLVEDDRAIRYVYSKMDGWAKYGFIVEKEASNGSQAIEMLKTGQVDVIFTDIRMPLMDGITMMKNIRQQYPDILFVFISSYNEFEYALEGIRMGALDYVVKPMGDKELEAVLARVREQLALRKDNTVLRLLLELSITQINPEEPVLLNMCRFLNENMDRNLTLEEVAGELQLNKDYFGKLIKKLTGWNFRNLYNQLKIAYAKPLVKSGQYKVYEISRMLGYSSADYFTQQFKAGTGMTPAEYRRS